MSGRWKRGLQLNNLQCKDCPPEQSLLLLLSRSVVSDSYRPRGLQPTRLLHPWDFPGRSTGVGCHCLLRTKHDLAPNVSSVEAKKIWSNRSRFQKCKHNSVTTSNKTKNSSFMSPCFISVKKIGVASLNHFPQRSFNFF